MAIHATIHGRLGRDPELKQVGAEQVLKLNVAADHGWGEKKTTTWVSVDVWGKRGASLQQHLSKGSEVVVRGELYTREYEKDGQKRVSVELRADSVDFAGGRKADNNAAAPQRDDDLPF